MQKRLQSKVVWLSLAGVIVNFAMQLGYITLNQGEAVTVAAQAILALLVAFGVLNNPTDKKNF